MLIKKRKPDMLFVQETKLENIDKYAIQRIWGNGDMDFVCSNAIGSSGGLLTIWRKDFFKVDNMLFLTDLSS